MYHVKTGLKPDVDDSFLPLFYILFCVTISLYCNIKPVFVISSALQLVSTSKCRQTTI